MPPAFAAYEPTIICIQNMKEIFEKIIEEIIRFILSIIIGMLLLWTGEAIISAITFGWHRPRWSGYIDSKPIKRVFFEFAVCSVGFAFWMISIPKIVYLFEAIRGL